MVIGGLMVGNQKASFQWHSRPADSINTGVVATGLPGKAVRGRRELKRAGEPTHKYYIYYDRGL